MKLRDQNNARNNARLSRYLEGTLDRLNAQQTSGDEIIQRPTGTLFVNPGAFAQYAHVEVQKYGGRGGPLGLARVG